MEEINVNFQVMEEYYYVSPLVDARKSRRWTFRFLGESDMGLQMLWCYSGKLAYQPWWVQTLLNDKWK
jgi:hypothetical protein